MAKKRHVEENIYVNFRICLKTHRKATASSVVKCALYTPA